MHIHVATSSDRHMEVGLHVMLYTLMQSLSAQCSATIHVFHDGFGQTQLDKMHATLKPYEGRYVLMLHDVQQLDLGADIKALHGNRMTYSKISMPVVVDCEELFYLDADMMVLTDLSALAHKNERPNTVARVVSYHPVKYCWEVERAFQTRMGVPGDTPYFNAGFILFNVKEYCAQGVYRQALDFIEQHAGEIPIVDQSVYNVLLRNKVEFVDHKFNCHYFPHSPELKLSDRDLIVHFVGSPKPWDFMGEYVHASYPTFKYYLDKTAFKGYRSYRAVNKAMLMRAYYTAGSYYKSIRSRLKGG